MMYPGDDDGRYISDDEYRRMRAKPDYERMVEEELADLVGFYRDVMRDRLRERARREAVARFRAHYPELWTAIHDAETR